MRRRRDLPPEHRNLAEAIIAGGGGLISELPIGMQPLAENFPTRNRILSGLCLGVVIVEAAEKSGSLITARMALEQDRQVFAVPGSPLSGKTRGSNRLLKEGAKLVECVEDVIEELAPQMIGGGRPRAERIPVAPSEKVPTPPTSNTSARPEVALSDSKVPKMPISEGPVDSTTTILNNLKESERLHVDSIIESSGLNAQTVLRLLLELELEGRVTQHPASFSRLISLAG